MNMNDEDSYDKIMSEWYNALISEKSDKSNISDIDFVKKVEQLELPSNYDKYFLNLNLNNYKKALQVEKSVTEEEYYYNLGSAAKVSLFLKKINLAKKYAFELLRLSKKYKHNWNYGNAIYDANLVLGLVAIYKKDIEAAKYYLLESGKTSGSPQLESFGPDMILAKELLKLGEKDVVLKHIEQCRVFWKSDECFLDVWKNKILAGQIPNFTMHLNK